MILGWWTNLGWEDHRSSTSSDGNCLQSASRALFTAHFGEFGNNCQNDTLTLTHCPCWPAVELWSSARYLLAVIACHLHLALPLTNSVWDEWTVMEMPSLWGNQTLWLGSFFRAPKQQLIVRFFFVQWQWSKSAKALAVVPLTWEMLRESAKVLLPHQTLCYFTLLCP